MKVKFENDEFPDKTEFDIGGLLLVNNEEVSFDDDEVQMYESRNGRSLVEALAGVVGATVDTRTLGKDDKVKYKEVQEDGDS